MQSGHDACLRRPRLYKANGILLGLKLWWAGRRADHERSLPAIITEAQFPGSVPKHNGYKEPCAVLHHGQHQEEIDTADEREKSGANTLGLPVTTRMKSWLAARSKRLKEPRTACKEEQTNAGSERGRFGGRRPVWEP